MGKKVKVKPKKSALKTVARTAIGVAAAGAAAIGAGKVASALKSRSGKGRRRRRRSAAWYAKETVRLRLKKKYEKARLGV